MKRFFVWIVVGLSIIFAIWHNDLAASEHSLSLNTDLKYCSKEKIQQLCAPANEGDSDIYLSCSIDFSIHDCLSAGFSRNIITKKLLFHGSRASGVSANFNGAVIDAGPGTYNYQKRDIIEISSVSLGNDEWSVPKNVTVKNAVIHGSVRIFGMGANSESTPIKISSQTSGHVERLRTSAPSQIGLEHLSIHGTGRNLVYFGPGVSLSSLLHSTLSGVSKRVGVYLDAESFENTIDNNEFNVHTDDGSWMGFYDRGWPQIAVDGSSGNQIANNVFKRLEQGGIYLYRNCGEGGTIRYGTPSHNNISHNRFELPDVTTTGRVSPTVYLGSRNYGRLENIFPGSHCNDDQRLGLNMGSARSNADFAQSNQVTFNVFTRKHLRDLIDTRVLIGDYIKVGNSRLDQFNNVENNRWVLH